MKIFMMLGWRNIWRNKRRSLVVISSIGVGIFAMMFSMGFMNGMNMQMVENTISTSLGHIAIHEKGFQDNMKLEYSFIPDGEIISAVKGNSRVKAFTERIKVQGMVRSSEASRGVMIVGIDPETERTVSKIYDYTLKQDGSRYLSGRGDEGILISKTMADRLDLVVGDRLVIMVQDLNNEIVGAGLAVTGLYESPVDSFDKYVVFAGIEKIREITGLGKNISEINVLLKDKDDVAPVKTEFAGAMGGKNLEILTWKEMAPYLVRAVQLFDMIMFIFFTIVFITVIFSVANTLIMAIMERFHEIGVMKSIGTRPSRIFFMIIFESMNLGLVGLAGGVASGLLVIALLSWTGIDFSFWMESMKMFGTGSVIYPVIRVTDITMAVVIVLFTTLIAALYPAVKAARIKPLEALHFI